MKQQYLNDFRVFLQMRNYAPSTIKSYLAVLGQYWTFCEQQPLSNPQFTKEKSVFLWFQHLTKKHGAGTVFSQNYSSLKLFYVYILKRDWNSHGILRPRRNRPLPEIMSNEEIDKLLAHTLFPKHKVAFLTLYATGLRIGELVNLKIEDVNSQTMNIRVRQGKGRKDRFVPMSEPLLDIIRQYVTDYKPTIYLFNGVKVGEPLSARAIQHAFQCARQKANLNPKITPHTLRHAFATHHMDEGTHLQAIKSMLGHTNIKTTSRYLHLSIQSLQHFANATSIASLSPTTA
jgi:integrase/recombinase XerD